MKTKNEYKDLIIKRIIECETDIKKQFIANDIQSFIIDDLLPESDAKEIYSLFPPINKMKIRKSLREYKFVEAQLDSHSKILEEITYAFQEPEVLEKISEITGIKNLIPDELLYAGGLSRMEKGQYLNPHIDNSHNYDRSLYRAMNLLYYVSPDRLLEDGGNLELWDNGMKNKQRTIHSKFNRLAVMITNKKSLHSVSLLTKGDRCCVSNYYFSEKPITKEEYFHVTSFRGFPHQKTRDIVLQLDSKLRMFIRGIISKGIGKDTRYKK